MQGISPNLPIFRKMLSKTSHNPVVCEEIPYAAAQGIFSCAQGCVSAFSTGAGKFGIITDCI
jgi:hypothetical protein